MVKIIAIEEIISNGRVVGFKVRTDTDKSTMDIKIDALVNAVRAGKVSVENVGSINGQLRITRPANECLKRLEKEKALGEKNAQVVPKVQQNAQVQKPVQANTKVPVNNTTSSQSQSQSQSKSVCNTNTTAAKNPTERIKQLVAILNKARAVYEQGTDEIMTNFEYDKLYDELLELEKKTGVVLSNSPTQNVGYEVVSGLEKVNHETPMLSLDKTKSRDELLSWMNNKECVLSWKLDGLTIVLTYNNGKLEKAVTRGDGYVGELVTNNAMHFKNIPHQIPFKGKLVVRGEATMSYKDFEAINAALPAGVKKYKNARNLCSSSVRMHDSSVTAKRNVNWFAFELIEASGYNVSKYIDEQYTWLKSLGFQCVDYIVVSPKLTDKNNLPAAMNFFEKKVETNPVPSDGLVITYRDKQYGLSLGNTNKFYRHSMAFKWTDEIVETTLINIEWQVGRTGVITPVAIFEPIEIDGTTVQRASLHNISVMLDLLGNPYVGQKIGVYKANMIIPTVAWGEKE